MSFLYIFLIIVSLFLCVIQKVQDENNEKFQNNDVDVIMLLRDMTLCHFLGEIEGEFHFMLDYIDCQIFN